MKEEKETGRRADGRLFSVATMVMAVLTAFPSARLTSQVGYEPGHSPYRDAPASSGPLFFAGYLSGGRGNVPVGISDGNTWGVRYNFNFGSAAIGLGAAYGQTTRRIVDPFVATQKNTSGLLDCDIVLLDATLQMALTGPKTWHGLAPYVGATVGAAVGSELKADTSGYAFGTKFTFGPVLGARYYIGRRLSANLDFRALFWRLSYPTQFKVPDTADGRSILSETAATNHWTTHPWISVGLGWAF